jgi:signal transduction histidine kinase
VVVGAYRVAGLDAADGAVHADIARSVVMPLVRAGAVDGALVVGRRNDRAFAQADVDQLEELSAIAALLIRNARFLAQVESSSRAKSNFISLAAHELGTPIAVIRGYVEMLGDETLGPVSPGQREPLDALRSTVQGLAERVDQLLVASRLEAGMSPPAVEADRVAELTDVVRGAIDRARDRARLIGADIAAKMPAGEVAVNGNARDLGTILDNLMNNAMTYSHPPARIRVDVADGETPEVRVADTGIGIPEWARERIFDQFYRVDDEQFGYPAGTGLGLYISRRLAERAGATLFVERSSPADGSVFVLRLQRSRA